jgi:class 3 adenylate cyclase
MLLDITEGEAATESIPPLSLSELGIPGYKLLRRLGSGRAGDVFLVEHLALRRRAALKILRSSASEHEKVVRFWADARTIDDLFHPSVVKIQGFGWLQDRRAYHLMELVGGSTLDRHLARAGQVGIEDALSILRGVAGAIDAAHAVGVFHGELTPSKIFAVPVEGRLTVKLFGFGARHLRSPREAPKTHSDTIVDGSMKSTVGDTEREIQEEVTSYCSPEERSGFAAESLSDIYTFGVLAFELLTGCTPFSVDRGAPLGKILARLVDPPKLSAIRPDLPEAVDDIVLPMLAFQRSKRPPCVLPAIEALEAILGVSPPLAAIEPETAEHAAISPEWALETMSDEPASEPLDFEHTPVTLERPEAPPIKPPQNEASALRRRLAAVLSAGAAGYTRLVQENDVAALRALSFRRTRMAALVAEHEGRVVDFAGDSMLAEFASTLDAFRCALFIQDEISKHNEVSQLSEQIRFRIGVHIGDVVAEGPRIYGDGVNIAARLQSLALPGGICVSGVVHEQLRLRVAVPFADLGEQSFKNILTPVRSFQVTAEAIAAACSRE